MIAYLGLAIYAQSGFESGASLRIYDIQSSIGELAKLVPGQTPNIDRRIDKLDIPNGGFGLKFHYLAEISGEFFASENGEYSFRITSDDGSDLAIDGKTIADADGVHAPISALGKMRLAAGWHKLLVRFFQDEGGDMLRVEWAGPKQADFVTMGPAVLRCPSNLTRVTAPGQKFLLNAGGKKRPGNGMPLTASHPAWKIVNIHPDSWQPQVGSMAFRKDGKLLVGTFKPNQSGELLPDLRDGKIWLVENPTTATGNDIKYHMVAENLQEPLGMISVIGKDGVEHIYVSQRTEISELVDKDGDGFYESTKTVAKAWEASNYHHFTFGLAYLDGFLYAGLSTSISFGAPGINGPNPENRGCVMRVDPTRYEARNPFGNCEFVSGGHRTPNGISTGPYGLILVPENQGAWQPADKVNVLYPGMFVGHYNNTEFKTPQWPNGGMPQSFVDQPYTHPAIYLEHNQVANSPCQIVVMPDGEFKDQLLITDIKYGGLRRGWLENVAGQWQGGAVASSQGFEVGTNRIVWGPDGKLYIGGTGATESWAWTDPKSGKWTTNGLQRMEPTGKTAFEITKVSATTDGFDAVFTRPARAFKPEDVTVKQWDFVPTPDYGGADMHKERLSVTKVMLSKDGKTAHLVIPGIKEARVVYLNFGIKSSGGDELWAPETWYSMNKLPKSPVALAHALSVPRPRVLVFTKTASFRHDSIPTAIAAIKHLGETRGFDVEATEDASVFTDAGLKRFDVVAFILTTGDVLNVDQMAAFERYMRAGHGFVGTHSATDTFHNWPFYKDLVGAEFISHPADGLHDGRVKIEDRAHPSTAFLPWNYTRAEEWYNFVKNPRSTVRVLASVDEKSYNGGSMGDHPVIWCQENERGRSWYTAMGHSASSYTEMLYLESLYQGIMWAAQAAKPSDAEEISFVSRSGWNISPNEFENGADRHDIFSKEQLGDCLLHVEFKIPKGSNSGVYMQGRYEVQIFDSAGVAAKDLQFSDCGGIYQRWKNEIGFEGTPPIRNAFRGPDQWNTYDILFRAPRFGKNGKKTEDARFVEVRLNGVIIQNDVTASGPTRASHFEDERPFGPLMLQGDHGPVAFRNLWMRPVKF